MKLISFIFIFSAICFANIADGQPAATKSTTYDMCYPDDAYPLNNALLTNLMSALPRKNDKACISFQATFSFKYQVKGANYRTEIHCEKASLAHSITFQRFDLAGEIMPVTAIVEVTIDGKTKTITHQLKNDTQIGHILTSDQPQRFKVSIKSVKITQEVLDRVVERQQAISAYYTADTQLKLAFENLATINPDSLALLDRYLDITRKNFAVVKRIKEKHLYKKLNLGEHDPLNVYARTNELHQATFEAKNNLTSQSNNLGEEYLRIGKAALDREDTLTAIEYFDKAIDVDSSLAGPYVEKAKIAFNRKKYTDVIRQIRFISAETTHHSGNRKDMEEMVRFIEDRIIKEAEQQNRKEHYQEALVLLDSAENICNSIQVVVCSDMINVARSHSWRGLLNQHIINWFDILSREQYSELPAVIEESFRFRKSHNKWLTTNELLYENMKIIQDTLLKLADQYQKQKPEKALEALYAAREICNDYTAVPCAQNLDKQFKAAFRESYKKMIAKANTALADSLPNRADSIQQKAMKYCKTQQIELTPEHREIISGIAAQRYKQLVQKIRNAKVADKKIVTYLDSAITIRKNYDLAEAKDEQYQQTRILTDYVSSLAEKTDRMIGADQIVIATELLQEIDRVVRSFNFNLNDSQQQYIEKLRDKIGVKACYEEQQKVKVYQKSAEKFINRNDYPHAELFLKKCIEKMKQHAKCGFETETIRQKLKQIKPAAAYQRQINQLKYDAVNNRFADAINQYDSIKSGFNDSILQPFGIDCLSLDELARQIGYLPFVHHAAKVLAERGKPNASFGLITYLYQHDFDHQLSVPAQEELGASLAKEFYIKDPSEESAALYKSYMIEKKWSKPFKKAFKKQWKVMQIDSGE